MAKSIMLDTIDKNCKTALSEQVSKKLIAEIRSGKIKPGRRMPGERRLAERFGISRGTVIEALDLLESQNYIERIPAKGTFVADDINHELSLVKIAFPFPEESISPTFLGHLENWGSVSEIYHGMIEEAKNSNAEIAFMHFEEAETDIQFSRQQRRIEDFDGAVFIGHQLSGIRERTIAANIPCVQILHQANGVKNCSVVSNDLKADITQIINHLKERGYKRLWILTGSATCKGNFGYAMDKDKIWKILNILEHKTIKLSPNGLLEVDHCTPDGIKKVLDPKMFQHGEDAIFCNHTDLVIPLYKFCMENDLKIGKDIGIWGYASGIVFNNMLPELTYGKIDHCNIGREACRLVIESVRNGNKQLQEKYIPGQLITGQST